MRNDFKGLFIRVESSYILSYRILQSKNLKPGSATVEQYIAERSALFNAWSTFSCPDSCERMGCKEPRLHIFISLIDLAAISLISGRKIGELFNKNVKIGFDPIDENEPWIGRVTLEMNKPCHFFTGKECSIYPGRPIACALFPEYWFTVEHSGFIAKKRIFQSFPCIQKPCAISPERKATLQQIREMHAKETFLSDFFLFGISPFVTDLKSVAGRGLKGVPIAKNGRAHLPHDLVEKIISQRLSEGGYLDDWKAKIRKLDQADGLEDLLRMKGWTDQMVMASDGLSLRIAYQFDGERLLPVHLCKEASSFS